MRLLRLIAAVLLVLLALGNLHRCLAKAVLPGPAFMVVLAGFSLGIVSLTVLMFLICLRLGFAPAVH